MKNLREIILDLREIYENDKETYSYNNLLKMMEENGGHYPSKATLSRLFGDNWEKYSYDYEHTIRPIAKVMIGSEQYEETDDIDTKTMKDMLKYKIERIEELERQIEQLKLEVANRKIKHLENIEKIKDEYQAKIDFRDNQILLKDNRIDFLMQEGKQKDELNRELTLKLVNCAKCGMMKNED